MIASVRQITFLGDCVFMQIRKQSHFKISGSVSSADSSYSGFSFFSEASSLTFFDIDSVKPLFSPL